MTDTSKDTALIVAGRLLSANTDVNDRVAAYNTIQELVAKLAEVEADRHDIGNRYYTEKARAEAAETALSTARRDALEEVAVVMGEYHWNRYRTREQGGDLHYPAVFTSHTHQHVQEIIRSMKAPLTTEGKDNGMA